MIILLLYADQFTQCTQLRWVSFQLCRLEFPLHAKTVYCEICKIQHVIAYMVKNFMPDGDKQQANYICWSENQYRDKGNCNHIGCVQVLLANVWNNDFMEHHNLCLHLVWCWFKFCCVWVTTYNINKYSWTLIDNLILYVKFNMLCNRLSKTMLQYS